MAAALLGRLAPIQRAALTSGALMALGDAGCQAIQCRRAAQPLQVDPGRAGRFGLIGLTLHGPFFYAGFAWLDRAVAGRGLAASMAKVLLGQVTLFPVYTTLVVLYASLLAGEGLAAGWAHARAKLPALFGAGSLYWPAVNFVNFAFVPPPRRILALNCCALAWNAFLSYTVAGGSSGSSNSGVPAAAAAASKARP